MSLIKVIIYATSTSKEPFSEWKNQLDENEKAIIRTRINRVKLGNFGDCTIIKSGKGLWELVIDHGPGYRIYFGKKDNNVIVLLTGGIKKSQTRDIEKAKKYWLECKELL
jgi:putative addiction module killer protein